METIWKTKRGISRMNASKQQIQPSLENYAFEADTNASSDEDGDIRCVSIDDIVEENRVLRKELFLLCEKLMELEQQERFANYETTADLTLKDSGSRQQHDELKNELHNLRLLNHELGRRALYLEEDRKKKENELVQVNVELLHLTPFKSQALDMKRSLDLLQSEVIHTKLLLTDTSENYERERILRTSLEEEITILETQLHAEKETNSKLLTQLTVNESIQNEASTQLLQQSQKVDALQIKNEQLGLKLQAMTDEVKHSQRRCESQSKEIARLKTLNDAASSTPPLIAPLPPISEAEDSQDKNLPRESASIPSKSKSKLLHVKVKRAPRALQRIESVEIVEDCTCGDFSFLRR